ncbi:MAG: hypothetical protein MI919_31860 [Holophagales bacterium]|nr:hypothetical protein [Holophagales bacterium]
MSRCRARIVLLGPAALLLAVTAPFSSSASPSAGEAGRIGEGREVVVVVDTSTSMRRHDSRRYTVQILRILADLLPDEDALTVIRMPKRDHCASPPDPRLAFRLRTSDRLAFDRGLDHHLSFDTGTHFSTPLRTATAILDDSSDQQRLLLVLADAGGLGRCADTLTRELKASRRSGVRLAAVHLGRGSGAFDGNPAFESTATARNAEGLVAAVALVYQRFLGGRQVQNGRVSGGRIETEVAPHVALAFLVVAADGDVGPVRPAAASGSGLADRGELDLDYRSGGSTRGLDGRRRSYRIVRLDRPERGVWRFDLPELRDRAGWMLVQESALGVRHVAGEPWVAGQPARLVVEVFDRATGQRLEDPESLPGLELTAEQGGRSLRFRDDGEDGDAVAGDGLYSVRIVPIPESIPSSVPGKPPEARTWRVRLRSELFDQTFTVTPEITAGTLELAAPDALDFGVLEGGSSAEAVLDLSASRVVGIYPLRLGSDLEARRLALEIDAGRGYERLEGALLQLTASRLRFPIRVHAASCPQAVPTEAAHRLWLEDAGARAVDSGRKKAGRGDAGGRLAEIPIEVRVIADPWLTCWWPVLALGAGAMAAAVTLHGFLVPSRFSPRAGLQLAQEEALDEGFFHPFRAQRRSGSGFYRDAHLFLQADFRLSSSAAGALARLRARGSGVQLLPLGQLLRRTADGEWEPLGTEERPLRPGVPHRAGDLFFELRNG